MKRKQNLSTKSLSNPFRHKRVIGEIEMTNKVFCLADELLYNKLSIIVLPLITFRILMRDLIVSHAILNAGFYLFPHTIQFKDKNLPSRRHKA